MKSVPRKTYGSAMRAIAVAGLAGWTAIAAHAGSHFTTVDVAETMFCDIQAINGDFSPKGARYVSNGLCADMRIDNPRGQASRFPGAADSTVVFQAAWTAQGTYNPTTKETTETITMPAPLTNESSPAGRPYGVFSSRMICATDPWLETGSISCTAITSNASGNLGNAETALRTYKQPLTVPSKKDQKQALAAAHVQFTKIQTAVFSPATSGTRPAISTYTLPEIIEPRVGVTYPQQTPLKVRVTPPRNLKVQTYFVQFEVMKEGRWQTATNESVIASELEGPLGNKGWGWPGLGSSAQSISFAGNWRVRARASLPDQGEAGPWREFVVGADMGAQTFQVQKGLGGIGLGNAAAGTLPATASTLNTMSKAPTLTTSAAAKSRFGADAQGSGTVFRTAPAPVFTPAPTPAVSSDVKKGGLDWSRAATSGTSQFPTRAQP